MDMVEREADHARKRPSRASRTKDIEGIFYPDHRRPDQKDELKKNFLVDGHRRRPGRRHAARSSSTPRTPRPGRRRARRSSWCARRPAPRTSAACTPPRAS
ncbi:MAG: hypothetical protein MZU95_09010 [Desulfomicrobium escambiense]|nr:hypothetical protein [Desulfomicrobium escambiense]